MEFRKDIRLNELEYVVPHIPAGANILEIGAGAGWQASFLRKKGFDLVAVDLLESRYRELTEFPIVTYDGYKFPFTDHSFDVVFSSNVLEHVPNRYRLEQEIARVLKPAGLVIHVLPSTAWRIWTSLSYHFYVFRYLYQALAVRTVVEHMSATGYPAAPWRGKNMWELFKLGAWPPRHGARGNSLLELYLFSSQAWKRSFRSRGWVVCYCRPTQIFYTGNELFCHQLSISARRILSYVLGSSTKVYLLRKKG